MADHARGAIRGEPSPDDAVTEAAFQSEVRVAWRYWAGKGRRPKGVVDYALGVGDYWREKDKWLSDIGRFSRTHSAFTNLYLRLRVCCEACDGYLVVRHRWGRNYRFAGCSTYTESGCTFTMGSRDYARLKSEIILDLGRGADPEHAFFVREQGAWRGKRPPKGGPAT